MQRKEHGATEGTKARLQTHVNASLSWKTFGLYSVKDAVLSKVSMPERG